MNLFCFGVIFLLTGVFGGCTVMDIMSRKRVALHVLVEQATKQGLARMAKIDGRSLASLVRIILAEAVVDAQEDEGAFSKVRND